jgi:hypothetical protein
MSEQSTATVAQRRGFQPGNRQGFQPGVSGNPQGGRVINIRADELFAEMAVDFGPLSATDTILLRADCRLLARAEKTKDDDAAIRLKSEARRGIDALRRRHASKRNGMLADLLQADHAEQRAAAEDAVHIQHQNGGTAELAADVVEASATPVRAGRKDPISDDGKGVARAKPKPAMALDAKPKPDAAAFNQAAFDADLAKVIKGGVI